MLMPWKSSVTRFTHNASYSLSSKKRHPSPEAVLSLDTNHSAVCVHVPEGGVEGGGMKGEGQRVKFCTLSLEHFIPLTLGPLYFCSAHSNKVNDIKQNVFSLTGLYLYSYLTALLFNSSIKEIYLNFIYIFVCISLFLIVQGNIEFFSFHLHRQRSKIINMCNLVRLVKMWDKEVLLQTNLKPKDISQINSFIYSQNIHARHYLRETKLKSSACPAPKKLTSW